MNIPTGPLPFSLSLLLLLAPDTFRTLSEHLDWHELNSPLPVVHRLAIDIVLPLMVQYEPVEMVRILDITLAPRLPRMVCGPRPMSLFLHERSESVQNKDTNGRTLATKRLNVVLPLRPSLNGE